MKAQTSWVSVTNSKLGPSTMASTGHASWQNPLHGRTLSEQSLQEASGMTPIRHYGSPHCLHHLLQQAQRHKAEGNLPVNALSHVNVIPANHSASFNEQQSRINKFLDSIMHHHHHHHPLDEDQHKYWRSQAFSQNKNFI